MTFDLQDLLTCIAVALAITCYVIDRRYWG